jgi:hypothetical protein
MCLSAFWRFVPNCTFLEKWYRIPVLGKSLRSVEMCDCRFYITVWNAEPQSWLDLFSSAGVV